MRRCLDSIALQGGVNREVLVIDGGSSDATLTIAQEYGDLVQVLVSEPDRGQSHAINKGLDLASGEVLCWLCCDDAYRPGALQEVMQAFGGNERLDVFSGACRRIFPGVGEDIRRVNEKSWARVAYNNEFDQPSMFWSRWTYEQIGGVSEQLHLAMDWDYWNRIRLVMREFSTSDSILSDYYFSDTNKTSLDPSGHLKETRKVVSTYCPYNGLTETLYSNLYSSFDLKGCYDKGGKVPKNLREKHHAYLDFAKTLFDSDLVDMYNWNWISKMERGINE
jgi:glycosyltransferase involved in cell wall biosynthesis